jgi:hypothetical protein
VCRGAGGIARPSAACLTNLMDTFRTLYSVNYLGTAERVFELVIPSSHAWKYSSSCEGRFMFCSYSSLHGGRRQAGDCKPAV